MNNKEIYNVAVELVDKNVVKGNGDKTAIYYGDEEISYKKLMAEVNKLGNSLQAAGIEMENRVILLLHDSPQFFYSFLGAIKIGAVAVPVNTLLRPRDYLYILNDSRAKVLIANEDMLSQVEPILSEAKYLQKIIVVGKVNPKYQAYDDFTGGQSKELLPAETCYDDFALWIYSSGTTGFPKGIVHLQHDMVFAADTYAKGIIDLKPEDRVYSASKLFFAYGLGNSLYYPFRIGASTVLCPERPEPKVILDNIRKYKPTIFFSVPTSYTALLQATENNCEAFEGIRVCVSAGEPLPEVIYSQWKERFGIEILDGLGCSEALNTFISNRPGEVVPGSTGKVVPGYETRIVDENGKSLPPGEIGTLQVKGDSIAAFYWNQHEKTKSSFLGNWFHTGDRFYQDEADNLWYVGRGDDMIKVGGIWVSPIEVERTILQHDAVFECGVIGKADENNLIKPKAYIALKDGYEPNVQLQNEIKQFVKKQIAHYKYPRWIQFVSELPKTATGKIKRFKLRELEETKKKGDE